MKQKKDSPIKNATADPREPWELPRPTLRQGAEDFLKLKSRQGQELRPYRPPMATIQGGKKKGAK